MKTGYVLFKNRIAKAKTPEDLARLEKSLSRIWDAGQFTVNEFMRLDLAILDKYVSLEGS